VTQSGLVCVGLAFYRLKTRPLFRIQISPIFHMLVRTYLCLMPRKSNIGTNTNK
jgi:hypothetical protein